MKQETYAASVEREQLEQDLVTKDQLCQAFASKILELTAERDALAAENVALKTNLMFWDAEDPERPYDDPSVIASNCEIPTGQEFIVQVAARMPDRKYRVSRVDDYDCEVELVSGKAPAIPDTDAFANQFRAEGVEMFAKYIISSNPTEENHYCHLQASVFASDLRAGKDGE